MRSLTSTVAALLAAAGLLAGPPARAAETQDQEMRALVNCAAALVFFQEGAGPDSPVTATDADRDLAARITAVEPRLERRANALAAAMGEDRATAIAQESLAAFQARAEAEHLTPRQLLDVYAPVAEACIVRARALPAV